MSEFEIMSLYKKNNIGTLNIKMFSKFYTINFKCSEQKKSFTQHELFNIGLLLRGTEYTKQKVRDLQLFKVEKNLDFIEGFEEVK